MSVRFADITGNGRADYLCIDPNGRVVGNLHEDDDSFSKTMQIKFSETMDRANLRWADVDGDGKDDMIWIEKFNGDGHVWYVPPFPSIFLALTRLILVQRLQHLDTKSN